MIVRVGKKKELHRGLVLGEDTYYLVPLSILLSLVTKLSDWPLSLSEET